MDAVAETADRRKRFGEAFLTTWGLLVSWKLLFNALGWDRGVLFRGTRPGRGLRTAHRQIRPRLLLLAGAALLLARMRSSRAIACCGMPLPAARIEA